MLDLSWLLRRHKGCPCFTNRSPSSVSAPPQAAEALEVLFQSLPPDSGMAFVLVTHLPVGYETSLPDILGRHSAMAVTIAGNGETIRAQSCVRLSLRLRADSQGGAARAVTARCGSCP
jgi:two-component system CheB/CheR fusion protein